MHQSTCIIQGYLSKIGFVFCPSISLKIRQHKSITTWYLRLTFNDFYISLKSFENTPDTTVGLILIWFLVAFHWKAQENFQFRECRKFQATLWSCCQFNGAFIDCCSDLGVWYFCWGHFNTILIKQQLQVKVILFQYFWSLPFL